MAIRILDAREFGVPMPIIARKAKLVVSPHMGAQTAVMNLVEMEPGEANTPHNHEESEDTIWIVEGQGTATDLDKGEVQPIAKGCVVFVPAGVRHAVAADAGGLTSVGGPVPPDLKLLRTLGIALREG